MVYIYVYIIIFIHFKTIEKGVKGRVFVIVDVWDNASKMLVPNWY